MYTVFIFMVDLLQVNKNKMEHIYYTEVRRMQNAVKIFIGRHLIIFIDHIVFFMFSISVSVSYSLSLQLTVIFEVKSDTG